MKIIESYFPRYSFNDWMMTNIGEIETLATVNKNLWIGQYKEGVSFDYLFEDYISDLSNGEYSDDYGKQTIWIYNIARNSL